LYDVYDDFSQYSEGLWGRVKGHVVNTLFYWMMTATLLSPPNLKRRFRKAYELCIGTDVLPIAKRRVDHNKLLITSNLDNRLDYDFIGKLAVKCPNRQIHIYGRIDDHLRDWPELERLLRSAKNVVYHGEFAKDDFQSILAGHSIALAPFKMNSRLTRSTDPSRFYDYLNAGLEVISTDIPRARERADYIHVVNDADAAAAVWQRLGAQLEERKAGKWDYREHLWSVRAQSLLELLNGIAVEANAIPWSAGNRSRRL
jgi:hypothetical protein